MPSDDLRKLHREGQISDRQYRRMGGVCGPDEINDEEYQEDEGDYGPDDAGHIDARVNKSSFPKEFRMGQQPLPGNAVPSNARVRAGSASAPDLNWYEQNTGKSRN